MTSSDITDKLTAIFRNLFEDETICLRDETTAADIEDWDSLAHMQLISETEDAFNIHFTLGEINSFSNVGQLCRCIEKHLNLNKG